MPSRESIQQLQKLFMHFKRHGGRNTPAGVTQIELVDDDDLTRWFVQLAYKDENDEDFYVSLQLVFSEGDGGSADRDGDGVAFRAGRRSTLDAPPVVTATTTTTTLAAPSIPPVQQQQQQQPQASPLLRSTNSDSDTTPAPAAAPAQAEMPDTAPCDTPADKSTNGSGGGGDGGDRQPSEHVRKLMAANNAPATTTAVAVATTSASVSRRRARMPLVFIVAPRLIAAFIHHGALCSLELMSQYWEPTPENMTLLLLALHETLNPFTGDGRVSVDDAERIESRRAAARAASGGGTSNGDALLSASAYSAQEHQLGLGFIQRAHPHLFRRHVDAADDSARHGDTHCVVVHEATAASATSGSSSGQPATKEAAAVDLEGKDSLDDNAASSAMQRTPPPPHVIRDVSHLNTAIYDALVHAYGSSSNSSRSNASAVNSSHQQQRQHCPQVQMLIDTPAVLADASSCGDRAERSGATGETPLRSPKHASSTAPPPPHHHHPTAAAAVGGASPSPAKTLLCTPALRAGLILRERLPAASHLAYAPTTHRRRRRSNNNNNNSNSGCEKCHDGLQRVVELWIPCALPQLPSPLPTSAATPADADATTTTTAATASGPASRVEQLADEGGPQFGAAAANTASSICAIDVCLVGRRAASTGSDGVDGGSDNDDADDDDDVLVACVLRNMRLSVCPARTSTTVAAATNSSSYSDDEEVGERGGSGGETASAVVMTAAATTSHRRNAQSRSPLTSSPATSPLRLSLQPSTAPSPSGEVHVCDVPHGLTLRCTNMYLYGHLRVFGTLVLHNCVLVGSITTEECASVQATRSRLALMPDDRLLRRPPTPARMLPQRTRDDEALDSLSTPQQHPLTLAEQPHPPPVAPPALFYAPRKECLLILDSSTVDIADDSDVYRLMPQPTQPSKPRQRSNSSSDASNDETPSATGAPQQQQQQQQPLAAMMSVLRSLIFVSNQGRLRLTRCRVHPGSNTERTVFAEQDAIVDMAYCSVVAAISSAVIIQGCRAFLEHCTITGDGEGNHHDSDNGDYVNKKEEGDDGGNGGARRAPVIRLGDARRSTGLIAELGGTLTARFCTVTDVYFAFCVIAHSVAHVYRCHAANVVNGYTVDASSATLDGCSARTNHVGVFVLRKAKCTLAEDHRLRFARRCELLGEAYDAARRAVLREMDTQKQQQHTCDSNNNHHHSNSSGSSELLLGTSAAAVAARTVRAATLARQYYAQYVLHSDAHNDVDDHDRSDDDAAAGAATTCDTPLPPQHLGICGGAFSLEVRDAALTATGVTLINARDTAVYAVDNSTVELEECVLWSTAEMEDAAVSAAAAAAAASPALAAATTEESAETTQLASSAAVAAVPQLSSRRQRQQQQQGSGRRHGGLDSDGATAGTPGPSPRSRQSSCAVKAVHSTLTAHRCLMTGFSFGVGAICSSTATLVECAAGQCMNGFTADHSTCTLTDCGADASHVGLFALNDAVVTAQGVSHVVGASARQRPAPRLICGGVPAVYCGDTYGVECKCSEMHCMGVTVWRGRDSGINVYSKSRLTLMRCLVDMGPPNTNRTTQASWLSGMTLDVSADDDLVDTTTATASAQGEGQRDKSPSRGRESSEQIQFPATAATTTTTRTITAAHNNADATATPSDTHDTNRPRSRASAGKPPPPPPPTPPPVLTSGVKVWSGSRCEAHSSEVRSVTFAFAALGPETVVEAYNCAAKHVVNGFTADGGTMQLTKCSASSNHVGVYVLSHGRCVVRRGSYAGAEYGLECRSGVLSLHGHVKVSGFARIGLYLYAGAHCEAEEDCVLDIHAQRQPSHQQQQPRQIASPAPPGTATVSSSAEAAAAAVAAVVATPPTTSCDVEEATSVSDLLPACIALDEATAHLPQAVLGGGARCGITCADGATCFVGQCLVRDCSVVGVNVFAGAHLTLANARLECAQRHAVVVHVGGVCWIARQRCGNAGLHERDGVVGHTGASRGNGGSDTDEYGELSEEDEEEEAVVVSPPSAGGLRSVGRRVWQALRHTAARLAPSPSSLLLLQRRWTTAADPQPALTAAALTAYRTATHVSSSSRNSNNNNSSSIRRSNKGAATTTFSALSSSYVPLPASRATAALHAGGATTLSLLNSAMAAFSAAATAHVAVVESDAGLHHHHQRGNNSSSDGNENNNNNGDNGRGGGCLRFPAPRVTLRRHLRWLAYERHRDLLKFHANSLEATTGGPGELQSIPQRSDDVGGGGSNCSCTHTPATTAAAAAAPARANTEEDEEEDEGVTGPVTSDVSSPAAAPPPPPPPPFIAALPSIQPAIIGSLVVRGTCTIERMLLRPTTCLTIMHPAPQQQQQQQQQQQPQHRETTLDKGSSGRESVPAPDKEEKKEGDGGGECTTASTTTPTTTAAAETAAPPPGSLISSLTRRTPAVHVYQHGVLSLMDCVIDGASGDERAQRTADDDVAVAAAAVMVVVCEGPYARLHGEYVRVVRTSSGTQDNNISSSSSSSSSSSTSSTSSRLPPSVSFHSCVESAASVAAVSVAAPHDDDTKVETTTATTSAAPALLLVSLRDGAQCTLHMVGTSLSQWPYRAAEDVPETAKVDAQHRIISSEGEDGGSEPAADVAPLLVSAPAAASVDPAGLVLLHLAKDCLAEASFSVFAHVAVVQKSAIRFVNSDVVGRTPPLVTLEDGSSARLLYCRVRDTRSGSSDADTDTTAAAAASVDVDATSRLTLFHTVVHNTTAGTAVVCAEGGRYTQLQSHVTTGARGRAAS
jgi:hypothetical protein